MSGIGGRMSNLYRRMSGTKLATDVNSSDTNESGKGQLETVKEDQDKVKANAKEKKAHGHSLAEQLMGAPLSLLVAGAGDGLGKSQLVDRVFGVAVEREKKPKEELDGGATETEIGKDGVAGAEPVPVVLVEKSTLLHPDAFILAADKAGFVRVVEIKSAADCVQYVNSNTLADGTATLAFDMAWYFVAADQFTEEDELACHAILQRSIPLLVCISRADELTPERAANAEEVLRTKLEEIASRTASVAENPAPEPKKADNKPNDAQSPFKDGAIEAIAATAPRFEIVQVSNPLPPTCMECDSKTSKRPVDGMPTMQGWYCTNKTCDLYGLCPFKVKEIPSPPPPAFEQTLHTKCKSLLSKTPQATRRYQIAQLIDTVTKFEYAKTFVITTTLISTGIGANPLPFVDAPILVATQLALVNSICSVYGFENASTYWGLFKNVMATPFVGLMGADLLKMIPGVGTVVGGVVDVVICATMTLSLGIATVRMCDDLLLARNQVGAGLGVGRPLFKIDAAVGAVFKEVYNSTKEAIRGLLKSGNLSKENLMGMMQAPAGAAAEMKDQVGVDEKEREAAAEKELEGLAFDLVIHERDELKKSGVVDKVGKDEGAEGALIPSVAQPKAMSAAPAAEPAK
ncbi:hypothetical protein HDU77_001939 [Chytriomyces hyalinus]|nr:hypothetical protein HDU77_001939 [Chytriomyces hyalinus]